VVLPLTKNNKSVKRADGHGNKFKHSAPRAVAAGQLYGGIEKLKVLLALLPSALHLDFFAAAMPSLLGTARGKVTLFSPFDKRIFWANWFDYGQPTGRKRRHREQQIERNRIRFVFGCRSLSRRGRVHFLFNGSARGNSIISQLLG
jgi:hypothetical protein